MTHRATGSLVAKEQDASSAARVEQPAWERRVI